jgi:RHS repeat-associated protein
MTPGIVAESDLSGNLKSEYVFFNGGRAARRDFDPTTHAATGVFYYFSDHLNTASVVTDSAGNIKADSDYYPWGGELQFVNSDSNHYKFTGKERDTESGLDYFGARYYSNGLGRFISADWSATPIPVPYADFGDPQSLNLYSYVRNIPTVKIDPDGHCCSFSEVMDFVAGAANAYGSDMAFGAGRLDGSSNASRLGAAVGDAVATVQGTSELLAGVGGEGAGLLLDATGIGAIVGIPANVASAGAIVHGGSTAINGIVHLAKNASESSEKGSYTNTHESGKVYHGKGDRARSQTSARATEKKTGDKHTATEFKPSPSDREAFKDESRRIEADGGAKSNTNYNKIDSPGTKYRKQDGSK